jgi:L-xylulokinase
MTAAPPRLEPPFLVAVDSGLTVTKAVVFDARGRTISVASAQIEQLMPRPHHVERDMAQAWIATAGAIREAFAKAAIDTGQIGALGVTGHGDGVYLVDAALRPLGHAVLSLDSRAVDVVIDWRQRCVATRALQLTGQQPMVAAPAAILAWMKRHEPERFARIGWVLSCKDWLRLCLTGRVATDPTEASVSFTNVDTQAYSSDALALFDLETLHGRLPEVVPCTRPAGTVTAEASRATGLRAGLPVVAGLHDVTAAAVGLGMIEIGDLAMVAGTYSINETMLGAPERDAGFFCRNAPEPGRWMAMSISPASSANIDWFLNVFCAAERAAAEAAGESIFDRLRPELDEAFARDTSIVFHPFLFGSPHGEAASAGFFGLKGWHRRSDVLKAVLEGIVFNHRTHVEALGKRVPLRRARLAGGAAREPRLAQLFADTIGMPVETVVADEVSAFGAALCAAVGCSRYPDIAGAVEATVAVKARHAPDTASQTRLDAAYGRYMAAVEAVRPLWATLADAEQ